MQISNKRIYLALAIAVVLMIIVLGAYLFNTKLLLLSLPLVFYVALKATSPIETLLPFAIIATWGAEIWNTGYPYLYTILRLSVVGLFFIKVMLNYKKVYYFSFFMPLLLFILYNIINELMRFPEEANYMFYINFVICYSIIYIVSRYSTLEEFEELSFSIGVGILFSAIITLVAPFIPSLLSVVLEMIQTDNSFGGDVIENRFSSLAYDPNLFGMYVDCAISLNLIVLIRRHFRNSNLQLILCCLLLAIGVMTLSKSYFLVTGLLLLYSFFQIMKSKNIKTERKVAILIICIIAGSFLVYYMADYFDALLSRFDSKKASELTTGRSDLASYYFKYLFDNLDVLVFGNTLLGNFKSYSYPHNFAIYLLFFFGILGTLLFFNYIFKILSLNKKFRLLKYSYFSNRNIHFIPLGVYILYSFTIDPFALLDVKMILLSASFSAWLPLINKV